MSCPIGRFGLSCAGPNVDVRVVKPSSPPHVAGFAVAGDPTAPIVCVRVEAGDGLGVWIGRRWPGADTYVVDDPLELRPITIEEARAILDSWPSTRGNAADAIQSAAWQGRRELIPARLRALMAAPVRNR